jgi:phosphatidylinositol alpha 1,6-mannosyltransferase
VRIVLATDSYAPKIDGVAHTSATLALGLSGLGHRVEVVAPAPADRLDGVGVMARPSIPLPVYPELRLGLPAFGLRRAASAPDAAIVMTLGPVGAGAVLALPQHVPVVLVHTTDLERYLAFYRAGLMRAPLQALMRRASRRARWTLAPTERSAAELRAVRLPRVRVWGRGVDTALFRPDRRSGAVRAELSDGHPDAPLVLYVGRLAREKRIDDLDLAIRMLGRKGVRFAFVGDGPNGPRLRRRWSDLPVHFAGYRRGEALADAFAAADAFVFPSDTDTFGQVVLQAMASGLPVIVIRDSPTAELVRHRTDGLHVSGRSPAALAHAIATLVDDPVRARAMGNAGQASAQSRSWPSLIAEMDRLLVDAVGAVGTPGGRS